MTTYEIMEFIREVARFDNELGIDEPIYLDPYSYELLLSLKDEDVTIYPIMRLYGKHIKLLP